jgi:hypothetical protein
MHKPELRNVERQATRMREMMRRLGVDPVAFNHLRKGDAHAEALARCLYCGTAGICLRWLDGFGRADRAPDFCPNLRLFAECSRLDGPRPGCGSTLP